MQTLFATDFIVDGIKYSTTGADSVTVSANSYTGNIIIPSTVVNSTKIYTVSSISDGSFYNCSGLTSVFIPSSVTLIGRYAFIECKNLININIDVNNPIYLSINGVVFSKDKSTIICCPNGKQSQYVIPNSVVSIKEGAFSYCKKLTSIVIPNTVTIIGDEAFENCIGLTSITIPSSVISIGKFPFISCSGLMFVGVDVLNSKYTSVDGVLYTKNKDVIVYFPVGRNNTSYIIPNTVTSIGDWGFTESRLTSVFIPNSVISIGRFAFWGCNSLTSIDLHDSITFIGDHAFVNCTKLSSVTIPSSIKSVEEYTFYNCNSLTSIVIPNSVKLIKSSAFSRCSSLSSCVIPDSVTLIGETAFYGCFALTTIIIPKLVKSIGESAFFGCRGLNSFIVNNSDPIDLSLIQDVFYNVNKTTCILYVPIGSKPAYQAAVQWRDFTNIVEFDPTSVSIVQKPNISIVSNSSNGLLDIKGLENSANISIYNLQGREIFTRTVNPKEQISINSFPRGVYIIKVKSKEDAFETKLIKQ